MARRVKVGFGAVFATAVMATVLLLLTGTTATAGPPDQQARFFTTRLNGFREVPSTFSPSRGRVDLQISPDGQSMNFTLTYTRLSSPVLFAHIHFGQPRVNGGVIAFFCGGGGKPACPPDGGTVTGTIRAADVVGPSGQLIMPGEFNKAVAALRAGLVYSNVHSVLVPGGEIRGQMHRTGESDLDLDPAD